MRKFVLKVAATLSPPRLQAALRRFVRSVVRWALADEIERLREVERESTAHWVSLSRLVDGLHNVAAVPRIGSDTQPSCKPLISIVTATWNRAYLLSRAIESMLSQTFPDWEMLIVDDGSTDGTESLVKRHLVDPRIRYFRQSRAGAAAARNRALKESRGEIIGYLDSDCQYYPAALADIARLFKGREAPKCAYFGQHSIDLATGQSRIWADPFDYAALIGMRLRLDLNAFFHQRTLFEELGGFDESLTRLIDWELILRYTEKYPPERLACIGSRYESGHGAQISNTETIRHNRERILARRTANGAPSIRVLYATADYPQLSESYIENEIAFMRNRGVEVFVWSKSSARSPHRVSSPVLRGPFAAVVRRWRPDVIHAHWLHTAEEVLEDAEEECIPVTVRSHGFEVSSRRLARVANARAVAAVYVFPHLIPAGLNSASIRPLTVAINTECFSNGVQKDHKMVLRLGAGLPTKDVRLFLEAAKQLPGRRFVMALAETAGRPGYVQEVKQLNETLGRPAEVRVNVPHCEAANLYAQAGIYLHTSDPAEPFGMPVSIGEAMAAGCYVLVRNMPGAGNYVGNGGACYESLEDTVALIRQTELWSTEQWEQQRQASVESARRFANEAVLDRILEDWVQLVQRQALE